MSSPIKRPPPSTIDTHIYMENTPNNYIYESSITASIVPQNQQQQQPQQNHYQQPYQTIVQPIQTGNNLHNHHTYSYQLTPSPPKKSRTRNLRTKLRKKAAWPR